MICPKCSRDVPLSEIKYCPYCGAVLVRNKKSRAVSKRANNTGNVYKRGKTWTARVTIGKKIGPNGTDFVPVRKTLGGFRTRTEALNALPGLIEAGTSIKINESFEQIYLKWKKEYESRIVKSTMDCYKAAYKHFSALHYKRFTDILATDLQACIDSCPSGKRTKENMKAFASLLYKYAINNNVCDKNFAQYLFTGTDPTTTREAFTMDELKVIKDSFGTEPYAPYVYAMCFLGFRPGEMLCLRKSAYHEDGKYLVGGGKTEAGTNRIVPVPKGVQEIIEKQLAVEGTDLLFPRFAEGKKGGGKWVEISDNYFRKFLFDPMMERLNIQGKVPYSCRHTYANLLKDAVGAEKDKAALMGHEDYVTTKYYQSTDIEHMRNIVDQLETTFVEKTAKNAQK